MAPKLHLRLLPLLAVLTLFGCPHRPAVPELDPKLERFPAVAAEYRTTLEQGGHKGYGQETKWRLWRNTDRIVTENLSAHTGAVWQRDGATVFHQKLFHDDHKAIEYQMDDLRMTNMPLSWARQSLVIDPDLLSRLKLKRAGWQAGYPYRRYLGQVDGSTWDITIRMDLLLPVTLHRRSEDFSERIDLREAHALDAAPWMPTSDESYERIDFADLGDRQADPFVVKVQDQLGRPHTH